jgi:hypothetical protein
MAQTQVLGKAMLAYCDDAKDFATVGGADLFNNADSPSMTRHRTGRSRGRALCQPEHPPPRPSQVS